MWRGAESNAVINNPDDRSQGVTVIVRKLYSPKTEISQALQKEMASRTGTERVRPESVEAFEIGGQQALRCLVDGESRSNTTYYVWIRSESTAVEFKANLSAREFAVFRWKFDRVLATVKLP
jgi:hypothetical protein